MEETGQVKIDFDAIGNRADHPLLSLPLSRPLVFFDLETTGLDIQSDRIVQFAFIKIYPDGKQETWESLVNPGIPIPKEASQFHGITDRKVKDKPRFDAFAPQIFEFLIQCDLAGFNIIRFDVPMLQAEMTRSNHPLPLEQMRVIDPQVIFHKKEPRDLAAAYQFYCAKTLRKAHDALSDIQATLAVFKAQLLWYPDLPRDLDGLHAFCNERDERYVTSDRRFYWRNDEAVLAFGKYKSRSLKWLRENDPNYLFWIINGDFSEETKEIVRKAINGIFPEKPKEEK